MLQHLYNILPSRLLWNLKKSIERKYCWQKKHYFCERRKKIKYSKRYITQHIKWYIFLSIWNSQYFYICRWICSRIKIINLILSMLYRSSICFFIVLKLAFDVVSLTVNRQTACDDIYCRNWKDIDKMWKMWISRISRKRDSNTRQFLTNLFQRRKVLEKVRFPTDNSVEDLWKVERFKRLCIWLITNLFLR